MRANSLPIDFLSVVGIEADNLPENPPTTISVKLLLRTTNEYVLGPLEVVIDLDAEQDIREAIEHLKELVEDYAAKTLGVLPGNIETDTRVPTGIGTTVVKEL